MVANRSIEQSPEIDINRHNQLNFNASTKVINWQKVFLFNRCSETTENTYQGK